MEKKIEKLLTPLTRKDIDFRVAQVIEKNGTVYASILAYKDARCDMEMLDNAVGQFGWQVSYQRDSKGVLQCGIGIRDDNFQSEWVWKWSNGTPSNFESEKGEYSDAFKRAGFMWGIGRQLYDFPSIFVTLVNGDYYEKQGKKVAGNKLKPNDWTWDISEDYQKVTARRKLGGILKEIFNSQPYKK